MHAVHTSHRNMGTYHAPYNEAKKPDTGPHGLHKILAQNICWRCLMSSCSGEKLTWAFNLQKGTGHTGTYKKLCSGWGPLIGIPGCRRTALHFSRNSCDRDGLRCSLGHLGVYQSMLHCIYQKVQLVPAVSYLEFLGHHQSLLSTTWEAPVCLLLFSSILDLVSGNPLHGWVAFSLVSSCFFLIVPCCWTLRRVHSKCTI